MNWDRIEGQWKELRGKARARWGKLTDDDLDVIAGKRDQLVGRLQQAYGWSREKVEDAVDDFALTAEESYAEGSDGPVDERRERTRV